jgi:hypothetical protein
MPGLDPLKHLYGRQLGLDKDDNLIIQGSKIGYGRDGNATSIDLSTVGSAPLASSDQLAFERLLSVNGAVFNGTTDDAPAVQAAIDTLGSDNKLHGVALPPGLTQLTIGSVNTCSYIDQISSGSNLSNSNIGIVIPSNVALDLSKNTVQVSAAGATAIGSTGAAVAIGGNSSITNSQDMHLQQYGNGLIRANGVKWALYIGNNVADHGPARIVFKRLRVKNGLNGIGVEKNTYILKHYDCYFSCTSGADYLITAASFNTGEAMAFFGCTFDSESAASDGLEIGAQSDVYLYGCSFDYLRRAIDLNGSGAIIKVNAYGCHFEFYSTNPAWSSSTGYCQVSSASGASQAINLFGGQFYQSTNGLGGTQLPYCFRPGNTGATAPYGITLDRVDRTLRSGTVINNASDTGRFVDNQ